MLQNTWVDLLVPSGEMEKGDSVSFSISYTLLIYAYLEVIHVFSVATL